MKHFTAFCLLALGAAAVRLESSSQSLSGASDSLDDALTQVRSDGVEFVASIADAIEEAHDDREDRSSSSSGDESDDSDDGAQTINLVDPFGNETDI